MNLVLRDKNFEILRSGLSRKGLAKHSDLIDLVCRGEGHWMGEVQL